MSALITIITGLIGIAGYSAGVYFESFPIMFGFKTLASLSFLGTGFISFYKNPEKSPLFIKYGKILLVGLALSFVADVLLEIFFPVGFGFFLLSQITYFVALVTLEKPDRRFWITYAILIPVVLVFERFCPLLDFGSLFWPLMIYMAVLVATTAKPVKLYKHEDDYVKLLPFGLFLFLFSDFVLQFKIFGTFSQTTKMWLCILNGVIYFPAQQLIAISLSRDCTTK